MQSGRMGRALIYIVSRPQRSRGTHNAAGIARVSHARSGLRAPEMPVFTVNGAVGIVGRTFNFVSRAGETLVEAKIVTPAKAGSRNRAFEAREKGVVGRGRGARFLTPIVFFVKPKFNMSIEATFSQ